MSIRLVSLGDGPPIPLDRPIVFVGRHSDCDVRIDSKKISRRHCCIVQLHDKVVIRDLGSTNGVYRNGQRVDEATLKPQDELQIANFRYQVVDGDGRGGDESAEDSSSDAPDEADADEAESLEAADRKPTQEIPNN